MSGLFFIAALQASTTAMPVAIDCAVTGTDGSREQALIVLTGQRRNSGDGYGAIVRVTRDDWSAVTFGARTDDDPSGDVRAVGNPASEHSGPRSFGPILVRYDDGGVVLLSMSEQNASGARYYSFNVDSHGAYVTHYRGECTIDRDWPVRSALPSR